MIQSAKLVVPALALALLCSTAFRARAQETQWCPKAGTVVHYTNTGQGSRLFWLGPDPSDPMLCRRKVSASVRGYLFGWESVDGDLTYTPDSIQRMHETYSAVLSGQKDEGSVDFRDTRRGDWHSYSGIITIKRQGQEKILIDGQSVNTIKLLWNYKVDYYSTNFTWTVWYDPDRRIFVKGTRTGNVGFGNSSPAHFEAKSITEAD